MATTSPTSGPQIQDFKVRNAIDQLTTGLNTAEATISQISAGVGNLISIGASPCSQVIFQSSITTGTSLAATATSLATVAQAVVDIVSALRTAKLMR